jgi:hypothetical protein
VVKIGKYKSVLKPFEVLHLVLHFSNATKNAKNVTLESHILPLLKVLFTGILCCKVYFSACIDGLLIQKLVYWIYPTLLLNADRKKPSKNNKVFFLSML